MRRTGFMIGSTMGASRLARTPKHACICFLISLPPWSSSTLCGQEPSRPFVFEGVSRCVIEGSGDVPRRADGAGNHCTTTAHRPNTCLWDHLGADTAASLALSSDRALPVGGHIKCCVMVHSRKARKLTGFCFLCIENDRVRSYCDHVSLSSPSSRRISSWGRASSAPLSFRKAAESGSSAQSGKGSRTR